MPDRTEKRSTRRVPGQHCIRRGGHRECSKGRDGSQGVCENYAAASKPRRPDHSTQSARMHAWQRTRKRARGEDDWMYGPYKHMIALVILVFERSSNELKYADGDLGRSWYPGCKPRRSRLKAAASTNSPRILHSSTGSRHWHVSTVV